VEHRNAGGVELDSSNASWMQGADMRCKPTSIDAPSDFRKIVFASADPELAYHEQNRHWSGVGA
jgi:hypothetical protein